MSTHANTLADDPASSLGLSREDLPGDPRVLQQVVDDFTFLRDTAWSVSQELDAFLAAASAGGFEGAAADALRDVVSGRLKTFVFNVVRAFSLAGEALAEYRLVLVAAQQAVAGLVAQAAGLAAKDPTLGGLKQQVSDQVAQVRDAEALMVRALEDASAMVSQPIKVPSLFERIWKGVEEALNITAMVLALASVVVDGPLGIAAAGAAAGAFAMTVADYARGRSSTLRLGLSLIGLVMPTTKGIWSLEEVGAGLRGVLAGAGSVTGKAAGVLSSPRVLSQFLVRGGVRTWQGLTRVPGLVAAGVRTVPGRVASVPGVLRGLGEMVGEDFAHVGKWYPGLTWVLSPHGAYTMVTAGRLAGALFTPMTLEEMATLGFRRAWRAAWSRVSLTNTVRGFGAGWASKGWQVTHATMDAWRMLENWRDLPSPTSGAASGAEPGPELMVPRPVKWSGHGPGSGALGEPLPAPVATWTARDLGHETFTHSGSGLLLPGGGPVSGLDSAGTPARSVSGLWVPKRAGHATGPGTLPPTDRLGAATPAPGGHIPLETSLPHSPLIVLDRVEQGGREGLLTTRSGLLVPADGVLSDLRVDPATLDSRMQAIPQQVTKTAPMTVALPPVRTGMIRERLSDPVGLRQALRLDGVRLREVRTDGQAPRWELIDAHGTTLTDRVVTPRATGGFTVTGGPAGAVHHFTPDETFEFRTVPLPGTRWQLRFETATGLDGATSVARPDGTPIPWNAHGVDIVRERPDQLTVRVRTPDANGALHTTIWHLRSDRLIRETPLASLTGRSVDIPAVDRAPRRTLNLLNTRTVNPSEAETSAARVTRRGPFEPMDKLSVTDSLHYNSARNLLGRLSGDGPDDPTPINPLTRELANRYRPEESSLMDWLFYGRTNDNAVQAPSSYEVETAAPSDWNASGATGSYGISTSYGTTDDDAPYSLLTWDDHASSHTSPHEDLSSMMSNLNVSSEPTSYEQPSWWTSGWQTTPHTPPYEETSSWLSGLLPGWGTASHAPSYEQPSWWTSGWQTTPHTPYESHPLAQPTRHNAVAPTHHGTAGARDKSPAEREEELSRKWGIEIGPNPNNWQEHFNNYMLDRIDEVLSSLPRAHTRYNNSLRAIHPFSHHSILGLYNPWESKIELVQVSGPEIQGSTRDMNSAFRHEIGHSVDDYIGWQARHKHKKKFGNWIPHSILTLWHNPDRTYIRDEFGERWSYHTSHRAECFISSYQFSSPAEYFAEIYDAYYGPKRHLLSPRVQNWFATKLPH